LQLTSSIFVVAEQSSKDDFAAVISTVQRTHGGLRVEELTGNPAVYITFVMT
jgi:hypothetical protein